MTDYRKFARGFMIRASLLLVCLGGQHVMASGGEGGDSPYIAIEPPFVVNYGGVGKIKYLKAELSLRVNNDEVKEAVQHHMPLIRNGLVLLLSKQTDETLATKEGKEELRQDALKEINHLLAEEEGEHAAVDDVLFTNFVMQ